MAARKKKSIERITDEYVRKKTKGGIKKTSTKKLREAAHALRSAEGPQKLNLKTSGSRTYNRKRPKVGQKRK